MTKTNRMLALLAAGMMASIAGAQDAMPDVEPAPDGEETTPMLDAPPAPEAIPMLDQDKSMLWRLQGGGELVGVLVKETPMEVFVDIGPSIIGVPRGSVLERMRLGEIEESTTGAGIGTGVYDPETGTLVFRSRADDSRMLSQQEILENVKRSVVLVSNPGGLGTGWIVDNNGRLVTNHHVVGTETYQTVTLFVQEGNQWVKKKIDDCKVEAFSSLLDIAIVQLDMEKVRELNIELSPLPIAPPGALEAGDVVYAVGNPGMGRFVLDHTISEGIASSLARNFGDVLYLQTTAAVNPGNSGGPLVNQRGEVVGLITLKAIFQEGVAFALPVDYIHHFLANSNAYAVGERNENTGFRYLPPPR